jgi:hypothetical protein
MNQQVRRFLGCAAALSLAVTACAANGDPEVGDGEDDAGGEPTDAGGGGYSDTSSGHDSGSTGYDSATGYDTGPTNEDTGAEDTGTTGVCTPSCTSDSECENSCPAAPSGGINCCDTSSGVCFANTSSTCPASGGNDP